MNNRASTSSIVSHFSSSEPVKAHGSITTWALNTTLPAGLSFGTSNGTIWGTPTLLQTTAKAYTIWANNSGGSSLVTVTITINDVAPGSFEYEPENNTLTNNTGVHLAPQFINRTTGNGSTWSVTNLQAAQGTSSLGHYMDILVGDTIYFSANDGTTGTELWAHDTSNHSTWQVADINNWITMGGLRLSSNPGEYMAVSVGDTIYFSAKVEQQGTELWAHNSTNGTTWRVADIRSGSAGNNPGQWLNILVGDVLYFSADDGSEGSELWAHNTSNVSTWQVADIRSGSVGSNPGRNGCPRWRRDLLRCQ